MHQIRILKEKAGQVPGSSGQFKRGIPEKLRLWNFVKAIATVKATGECVKGVHREFSQYSSSPITTFESTFA